MGLNWNEIKSRATAFSLNPTFVDLKHNNLGML